MGSDFGTVVQGQDPGECTCQSAGAPFPCSNGNGGCGYWTSPTFDFGAYELDIPDNQSLFAYGQFLGQFWDALRRRRTGRDRLGALHGSATGDHVDGQRTSFSTSRGPSTPSARIAAIPSSS